MGMSTRIGRNVVSTTCECIIVNKDNNTEKKTVTLAGDYSNEVRATNACKKKLKVKRLLVQNISTNTRYYSMPIETFVKNADRVTVTEKEN